MRRLLGSLVVLGLIGGAVWIGLASDAGRPKSERRCPDHFASCPIVSSEVTSSPDPGHVVVIEDVPACDSAKTDLGKEPNYPVNYIHRWQDEEGCDIRLDILMTRQGADACGGEKVADILMGTPLGREHDRTPGRIFIRDPEGIFRDEEVTAGFDENAQVPAEAKDTGYRQDGAELWMAPEDDFLYLVYDDHNERWPQDRTAPGCG